MINKCTNCKHNDNDFCDMGRSCYKYSQFEPKQDKKCDNCKNMLNNLLCSVNGCFDYCYFEPKQDDLEKILEQFKNGEIALNVTTREDYNRLMLWCDSRGLRWVSSINKLASEHSNSKLNWDRGHLCITSYKSELYWADKEYYENKKSKIVKLKYKDSYIPNKENVDKINEFVNKFVNKNVKGAAQTAIKQEFTKDDLKVGMVVESRDSKKYIAHKKFFLPLDDDFNGVLYIKYYDLDLTDKNNHIYDIVKVYTTNNLTQVLEGKYDSLELIWKRDAVQWDKVAVDTKILVKQSHCSEWFKRYFAKYENGKVYAWATGKDSFTANNDFDSYATVFDEAKLYKDDEASI